MARVTEAEVKLIMDGCTTASATVDAMINAAEEMITKIFEGASNVTDAQLKEIERWFVAHMLSTTIHRTTSEEKVGDASAKYTGRWGTNLESTPYGQMVLTLDITGRMANIGKRAATIISIETKDYDI